MAKIMPFRAISYNPQRFKDLRRVVCPPYDTISPNLQEYYHDLDPFNFVHILLGKDIPGEDKYQRAADYFRDWFKEGIFIQDDRPALYFYSQQYHLRGEKKTRLGFIALLHLADKDSSIFGHEQVQLEPKEDRLKLLEATRVNLSPIFVLFSDKKRIISQTYQQCVRRHTPFINIIDEEKNIHQLWRLDSQDTIEKIQSKMQEVNIFIADGHHRYEVACTYRDLMKKRFKDITGEESFNYILAYFTNVESAGLAILPIHRLVKLPTALDNLMHLLPDYFAVEEIKDKAHFFFLLEKAGKTEHVIGMYKDKRYWLLRLKNIKILDRQISDKPPELRRLDISVLNYIILKKILGLDLEDKENITFSHNADELIQKVDTHTEYIAFFLTPVKIQQVMRVAASSEKLPAKSTYFYPKVLSGLVINKLE